MRPFRKILVAADFSGYAAEAVRIASELSKLCDAPLTLVHVYQLPIYPLAPEGIIVPISDETIADNLASLDRDLATVAAQATEAGAVAVDTKVRHGVPAVEIIEHARDNDFDLIALGTRGRTGLKHVLLGSVASNVVRRAPCAVLTVRPPAGRD